MSIRIHIVTALLSIAAITSACEAGAPGEELEPRSLADTELDGRFTIEAGRFVFDGEAQRAFDYMLTASEELAPEQLDAWVDEQVRLELERPDLRRFERAQVHAQIMDAWRSYLSFRAVAAELLAPVPAGEAPDLDAIERGLLEAVELHLGDAPIAVTERARIEHGLAVHEASQLGDLDRRQARLAELSAVEAEEFAASDAGRYLAGREAITEAEAAGADAQTIAALRVEHFDAISPGAGSRLAALDARRAEWDARVAAFASERAELELRLVASPEQLEVELRTLSEAAFSPAEQRRLRALGEL